MVSEGGVVAEDTWGTGSGEAVEGIGGTRSGEAAEDFHEIRGLLPERLFATDRFPCERVNTYSAVDHLLAVRNTLKGTPEMETLLGSCFGSLFKLPVRRVLSGKAVHGMLTRQVVTKKKYELWPVFGGNPFRFLLAESGEVTGLPCGEFEEGYRIDSRVAPKEEDYDYWERLIGSNRQATIKELVAMVTSDEPLPGWRKLGLCLIIIVDGVLATTSQTQKPSVKNVKRVESLEKFFAFQWGRESFLWTITTMKPAAK